MKHSIKSRIWIEADGQIILGEGRVRLLKAIDRKGSISAAAKSLGMSYKKAWSLVDAANTRAESPLVNSSTGGKGGGGATLTDYGRKLVNTFETINSNCWKFLDKEIGKTDL